MVEANIPAGETAPVAVDNNADGANAPGAGETITLQQRPEWVPEKFFKDGVVNFKEMAKSYGELEKAKSAPAPVKSEAAPVQQTPEQIAAQAAADKAFTIPGVSKASLDGYTAELTKDGKLSEKSYTDLVALGYNKTMVDAYIKGMTVDQTVNQAVSQARIADKQIAEITTAVGGQQVLGEMLQWAVANLEPAELKAYNEAVSSSDVSRVKLAVNGLYHEYSKTVDPALLQGERSALSTVEPFLSNEEVVAAMQNPKYDRDPAYRAMVAERIRVSDVFQQSRAIQKESYAGYQS